MRVCYYNRLLDDPWSSGVHARSVMQGWRGAGHDVLCLPHDPGADGDLSYTPRYTWLQPDVRAYAQDVRARVLAPRLASRYGAQVRAFRPHVLIVRRSRYDYGLDRLLRESGLPYVAEVNALVSEETRVWAGEKPPPWEYERERAFLLHAAGARCVTEKVRDGIVAAGVAPERTAVIPNGVDPSLFSPDARPDPETAAWARGHSRVLGFTGSLSYTHDTATLLSAAARVARESAGTGFLFVGPTLAALRASAGWDAVLDDRVRCTGRVPHRTVPGHLVCATVLWASFLNDYGSPLKLYEYMGLGKPVLIGGGGEQPAATVASGDCGVVTPAQRPDELAAAATTLLSLPDAELQAQGARGRRWVTAHSTWAAVAAEFLDAARRMVRAATAASR